MKKILTLAVLMAMLLPVISWGAFTINPDSLTSMNARLQFLIVGDTTGGLYPDSLIKWVAVVGTTNPPTVRADSQSYATPVRALRDTANVGGFYNNQVIYCQIIATLRHGPSVATTYTSPVDSAHTKNITTTITNIADSMTYRWLAINVATTGLDSIFRKILAQVRIDPTANWDTLTKTGNFYCRDSTYLSTATPDTLRLYGAPPYDLRDVNFGGQNLDIGIDTIYVRVVGVGNDTVGTDTSNTLAIALPAIPAYQSTWVNGNKPFADDHLEGGALFKSSLYSFTSRSVYTKPYRKFKAQARVFGTDNNQPCDSFYLELFSWNYGAWTKIATLVSAQIDTARTVPVFYDLWDSTNIASTFLRGWGDSLRVQARDKDTTGAVYGKTIDTRGFEYRLDFKD